MRLLAPILHALAVLVLLGGCAAAQAPRSDHPAATGSSGEQRPRGTLRIGWDTEPESLIPKLAVGVGLHEYNWVFASPLTYYDVGGTPHPLVAKAIPSLESGDWVVFPDGRMTTTYRLRENARWHDGTPLTAADYAFAFEVYTDPEVPIRDRLPEVYMSRVETPDAHTVVLQWKELYNLANLLGRGALDPLPRHLVESKYRTNKPGFLFGNEWTTDYVGIGPYRLQQWTPGVGMTARAFDDWFLGPPKIETLEIRIISDTQTLLTNLLSGEVDLVNSPGVYPPEAAIAREQWVSKGSGYLKTWLVQLRFLEYQSREVPNWQRAVTDLRVRKALLHAIDRDTLADVATLSLAPTGDVFLAPTDVAFPDVERVMTRHPYDPSRTAALLAELGWTRASLDGPLTDAAGQTLDVPLWTTSGGRYREEAAIITDYWKRAGVNASFYSIPSARARDNEHRVSFPAFGASARTLAPTFFVFTSEHLPLAESRWQGANRGSFVDADVDRYQSIILRSLDARDQRDATVRLHKRMTDILGILPLYYGPEVLLATNNLRGPQGEYAAQQGLTWNVFAWELTTP